MPSYSPGEPQLPPAPGSGMPLRERLRIYGIGVGIGLVLVGLFFLRRQQMKQIETLESAGNPPGVSTAPAAAATPPGTPAAPSPATR